MDGVPARPDEAGSLASGRYVSQCEDGGMAGGPSAFLPPLVLRGRLGLLAGQFVHQLAPALRILLVVDELDQPFDVSAAQEFAWADWHGAHPSEKESRVKIRAGGDRL